MEWIKSGSSDTYFLEFFFLFVLSVSLSKIFLALVSNDIWWIEWLCHWISIGMLHGHVKQFDVLKIAVTNYLMDDIGFNKMKNLSVEFYSNMIYKGIVMSICINLQLSTFQINWSVNLCTKICSNNACTQMHCMY